MIGIHGIGGMGKSTLARAVYNCIAHNFDGLCYLENIRKKSNDHGLEHIQSILLSELLGEKEVKLSSLPMGVSMIKHRLKQKKVLLILDDVDKLKQLQDIAGKPDWFGPGSRIIITTRDKQLLASHEVKRTYKMKELCKSDALQLLTWNAFKTKEIDPSYLEVLNQVVAYASGLPLALEVMGSNLIRKSTQEWKSACEKYKRIPNSQVLEILKVSFDDLEEEEKNVFLDIACCLKGENLIEIEYILRAHYGYSIKYHIGVLVQKSLIKHGYNGTIKLHDLIEDMGKEIVRQESPKEPGKRSRLWFLDDIIDVLENNRGTSETKIIHLNYPIGLVEWNGKAFKKMKNLRTLIIGNGKFSKDPKYLPNSLRVLEWWGYPSHCLPPDFQPKNLAICKLPNSCLTSFGFHDLSKKFANLKDLNFDNCECLRQISIDASSLSNLEKLSFIRCKNLITVDESVGYLEKLRVLNAFGCTKLRGFPPLNMTSLEELNLSECYSLERFPEILGKMENIRQLELYCTSIEELPFSFQNLIGLQQLSIFWNSRIFQLPSSIVLMSELTEFRICNGGLERLQWLNHEEGEEKVGSIVSSNIEIFNASRNNFCDNFFSRDFTTLFALVKELYLSYNNFTILPKCIKELQFLWKLDVSCCKHLREIRGIPPSLKHFNAQKCESLTRSSANILLKKELHETGNTFFRLPGERIPEWFDQHSRRPSISFWFRNKFPDKILCLLSGNGVLQHNFDQFPLLFINGNIRERRLGYSLLPFGAVDNDTYIFYLREAKFENSLYEEHFGNEWNHVQITYGEDHRIYSNLRIHIFKQGNCMEDVRFTDSYDPYGKRKLDNNVNRLESQNPAIWNKSCTTLHDWVTMRLNGDAPIGPVDMYIQFGIVKELTPWRRNELMHSKKWEVNSSLITKKNRLLQDIRRVKNRFEIFFTIPPSLKERVGGLVMRNGWATVICDGVVSYGNQKAVCAAVITNHMECYVGGFAKDLQFMFAIEAELWGVFYGIRLAIAKGFSCLMVWSDSTRAVSMLRSGTFPPLLSHAGHHINSLVENLQHVTYRHSERDMNILAYLFAKHGLSVDNDVCFFDSPPWA